MSDFVRSAGYEVTAPVDLRSTNNVVIWLAPSPVVAKISDDGARALRELEIARALESVGAPIVPPLNFGIQQPWRLGGKTVTFWRYQPHDDEETISAHHTALALHLLHSKLATLEGMFVLPSFDSRLQRTVNALDSPGLPVDLSSGDRLLLRRALIKGMASLGSSNSGTRVLHGSPHRMNILSANGVPVFIDFETVETGPVEWDLAHLDREVADRYPEEINQETLEICRRTISAATSTWWWESLERGPDMRFHAEQHLEAVRSAMS